MNTVWSVIFEGRDITHRGTFGYNPVSDIPSIESVAHSLSLINRFSGHTVRPYSVAEHSLHVFDLMTERTNDDKVLLASLLHDAHESIIGDITSPVKHILGPLFAEYDKAVQRDVLKEFGLYETYLANRELIRECDLIALATERRDLLPFSDRINRQWPILDLIVPDSEIISLETPQWQVIEKDFLRAYYTLSFPQELSVGSA